jgi:site-specific DNA-methyltransferase (adenine-specific)
MLEISHIVMKPTPYRGITIYENKDWAIKAVVAERRAIKPNQEYDDIGVYDNTLYFLVGEDENGNLSVYVGRAFERQTGASVVPRTKEHKKSKTEKYRDSWDTLITFKFDNIIADEVRYLENYFFCHIDKAFLQNDHRPDCGVYTVNDIRDKVIYIEEYTKEIVKQDIFIGDPDLYTKVKVEKDVQIDYSDAEKRSEGKRLVPKEKEISTEVHTPSKLVNQILDSLPADIWNPNTKFIDLACKNGEFLKGIINRLLKSPLYNGTKYENAVQRVNHIMDEQIYGIAISDTSFNNIIEYLGVNKRNCHNIIQIDYYIDNIFSNREYIIKEIKERFGLDENMKFDVVVGNPPYQIDTNGGNNGGKVLYDKFIYSAMSLADTVCMIVKNNWMNSDSLKELRDTMLRNGLNTVVNYSLLGDVFPTMGIAASIIKIEKGCETNPDYKLDYSEIQKDKTLNEYSADIRGLGFIPASMYECTIVQKVRAKTTKNFKDYVVGISPFGINTNGALGNGEFITESDVKTDNYNILIRYDKSIKYTSMNSFTKNKELVGKYKIICPKQIHKTNNPIPKVLGLKSNEICSASFSLMYYSDDQTQAVNVYKYIKTRFFRFLVYCLADSLCGLNSYRVSLVPDQDFTSTSDIDWSQSISSIDDQLYKKYHLSDEEIAYIKSTIKSMEPKPQPPKLTKEDENANYIQSLLKQEQSANQSQP